MCVSVVPATAIRIGPAGVGDPAAVAYVGAGPAVNRPDSRRRDQDAVEVEPLEIGQVVGRDPVHAFLACTVGMEGVVDRSAARAPVRDLAENGAVVGGTQRNDGQAAEHGLFDEPPRLVRRYSQFQRQSCQRRVNFGQRVDRATTRVLAARTTPKLSEGRVVGAQLVHQSRDRHRGVEQRSHSAAVADDAGSPSLAFGADELADVKRRARGPVMDENALLANERRLHVGPAKGDPVSGSFDLKFAPGSQVELLPERLRHDQPSSAIDGNDHAGMVFRMPKTINSQVQTAPVHSVSTFAGFGSIIRFIGAPPGSLKQYRHFAKLCLSACAFPRFPPFPYQGIREKIVSRLVIMLRIKLLVFFFVLLILTGCDGKSLDIDVPPVDNETQAAENLPWLNRAAMDAYMRYGTWRGKRSGFIAMYAVDGQPVYANAAGWADIEEKEPMQLDTRVRIASMTKVVVGVAAMILVDEGKLGLDDPIAEYIPAFADSQVATSESKNVEGEFDTRPVTQPVLVRHLLMFASGIGFNPVVVGVTDLEKHWEDNSIQNMHGKSLAERIDSLGSLPLFEEPGTKWRYGYAADVLARVVEVAAGQPFDEFLQQRLFSPLGMTSTSYLPDDRTATVYSQNEEGELILAPLRDSPGWTPGGTGLISTAGDYMRFALMLWNGGEYQGVRILNEQTVADMVRPHLQGGVLADMGIEGIGWGLGMSVIVDSETSYMPGVNGDFGWSGFYGTHFAVSPSKNIVGVVLTQNEPNRHQDPLFLPMVLHSVALF